MEKYNDNFFYTNGNYRRSLNETKQKRQKDQVLLAKSKPVRNSSLDPSCGRGNLMEPVVCIIVF